MGSVPLTSLSPVLLYTPCRTNHSLISVFLERTSACVHIHQTRFVIQYSVFDPDWDLCPLKASFLRSPVPHWQSHGMFTSRTQPWCLDATVPSLYFLSQLSGATLCAVPVCSQAGHGQLRFLPNTYSHPCSCQSVHPAVNPSSRTQQRLTRGLTTQFISLSLFSIQSIHHSPALIHFHKSRLPTAKRAVLCVSN